MYNVQSETRGTGTEPSLSLPCGHSLPSVRARPFVRFANRQRHFSRSHDIAPSRRYRTPRVIQDESNRHIQIAKSRSRAGRSPAAPGAREIDLFGITSTQRSFPSLLVPVFTLGAAWPLPPEPPPSLPVHRRARCRLPPALSPCSPPLSQTHIRTPLRVARLRSSRRATHSHVPRTHAYTSTRAPADASARDGTEEPSNARRLHTHTHARRTKHARPHRHHSHAPTCAHRATAGAGWRDI